MIPGKDTSRRVRSRGTGTVVHPCNAPGAVMKHLLLFGTFVELIRTRVQLTTWGRNLRDLPYLRSSTRQQSGVVLPRDTIHLVRWRRCCTIQSRRESSRHRWRLRSAGCPARSGSPGPDRARGWGSGSDPCATLSVPGSAPCRDAHSGPILQPLPSGFKPSRPARDRSCLDPEWTRLAA